MALYNLAGFKTTTLGTADVVFNAPVTALNTFPLAGVPNGSTVTYMLENFDGAGSVDAREVGRGVWNSGTLTLARTTVVDSTNGGAKIVLGGTAEARITAIAQDFSAAEVGAPALVAPSVAGNFASFSNVSGGQADSGFSGASFQPVDATLTSIAALGTVADRMIYTTALDTWAEAVLTSFGRDILDDANAAAVRTTIGAQAALGYTPVNIASADYIDLTDGGATTLHTHAGGGVSGSGVVGQLAEWVTNTTTLQAAKIIGPVTNILTITNSAAATLALAITSAKTLTLTAVDNWNLTVPATGTAALLATANVFTTNQMIDLSSDVAALTIQGAVSQTAKLLLFENSSGIDLSYFNAQGEFYFNNAARDTTLTPAINVAKLGVAANYSSAIVASLDINSMAANGGYGLAFTGYARPGSGNLLGEHYAVFAIQNALGTAGTVTRLAAFNGRLVFSASPTITNAYLFNSDAYTMSGTPTVTNLYGINIPVFSQSGGTVVNQYGINLGAVDKGTTLNYSIFTAGGPLSFLPSKTVASAAGAVWAGFELRAATLTISGSTNITTATGVNLVDIARPTLSAASALTVTNSATLYIANSPLGGGAGPVTITNAYAIWVDAGLSRFDGGIDLSVANIQTDTATGTKIGTATAQKLGFWNVTPIIQPAAANQAALTNSTTGTYNGTLVDVGVVFSQAAINDNFTDVHTLLNEIRTALVNSGLMKGAA